MNRNPDCSIRWAQIAEGHPKVPHRLLVFAEEFGAAEDLVILAEGDHRLRKLPQVEFQKRCHRVNISGTAYTGSHDQSTHY